MVPYQPPPEGWIPTPGGPVPGAPAPYGYPQAAPYGYPAARNGMMMMPPPGPDGAPVMMMMEPPQGVLHRKALNSPYGGRMTVTVRTPDTPADMADNPEVPVTPTPDGAAQRWDDALWDGKIMDHIQELFKLLNNRIPEAGRPTPGEGPLVQRLVFENELVPLARRRRRG